MTENVPQHFHNSNFNAPLKGIYAVLLCYGQQLKFTQLCMFNTHKSICQDVFFIFYIITHAQSLATTQNVTVKSRVARLHFNN